MLASGGELLTQLKGNHPGLQAAVQAYCRSQPPDSRTRSADLGQRNRLEYRTARCWALPPGTGHEPWHDHFRTAIEVCRHVEVFDTARKCFVKRKDEPAYYLATGTASASTYAAHIRAHWGIENRLHHILDTALDEDASRIRRNPGIFALVRHFALNLLRHNGETCISQTLYNNALSLDRVLKYKGVLKE